MNAAKRISLALQGGGSHGAYTWGALDAILADERLEIAGVSGTSAGAMNAVVMAAGLLKDRAAGARKAGALLAGGCRGGRAGLDTSRHRRVAFADEKCFGAAEPGGDGS